MFKSLLKATFALAMLSFVGCGPASVTSEPVTPAPPPAAKAMLTELASSGELGSGAESIRAALEELKATDAAKGEDLLKDMDQLEKMTDPSKVKAKAKAMADKL